MKLSVVIPAYGAVPWLEPCLQSLRGQGRAADEIIVFHSGPHDPSPDLAARFPEVRFLHEDARHFAGAARNRGAAAASGDWLAFLDCDMRASPGWLAALERAAMAHPADLLVGSIGRVDSGGAWSFAMWLIECGSVLPHRPPVELRSGPGANLAIARDRFAALGGFPEDLFAAEDGEFGLRLRATGGAIRLVPQARADHTFPGGTGHSLRRLRELGRAAAHLRRGRDLPGSVAVRRPWLAFGLPFARLAQMARRLVTERGPLLPFIAVLPLVTLGLFYWAAGFRAEAIRPTYPEPGP